MKKEAKHRFTSQKHRSVHQEGCPLQQSTEQFCACLNSSLLGHGLHLSKTQKAHLSIFPNKKNGIPTKVNSTAIFVSQKCLYFVVFCPQVRGGQE